MDGLRRLLTVFPVSDRVFPGSPISDRLYSRYVRVGRFLTSRANNLF